MLEKIKIKIFIICTLVGTIMFTIASFFIYEEVMLFESFVASVYLCILYWISGII